MKKIITLALINSLLILSLFYWIFSSSQPENLGATILSTATTDTIGTFRTNVNTSLDNLNNAIAGFGPGTISTSTAVTSGYFPMWTGLGTVSGTSSIFQSSLSVGIGTIAPSTTLDVIGTFRASGAVAASSTLTVTGASIFGSTLQVGGAGSFLSTLQAPTAAAALTTAGQIKVNSTTSTLVYFDGTAERALSSERCDLDFVIESPSASEDDYMRTFNAAATISKVYAVQKSLGDTTTFNLVFGSSRTSATSTTKSAFSSYTAVTASTTPTSVTINGSTTIASGDVMRLTTTAASSSQFGVTVCTRINP